MSDFTNPPDPSIYEILGTPRTIAVVGCSPDPTRDSHQIALLLKSHGHTILPVNPHCREILNERCYPHLSQLPLPIDMIDVFRRPEFVDQIVDGAIAVGASILWLQLGVICHRAASRALAAGMKVVMDRCPAIEYRRLFATR